MIGSDQHSQDFNQSVTSSFLTIWNVFSLTHDHIFYHEHVQNLMGTNSSTLGLTLRIESALTRICTADDRTFTEFSLDALTFGIQGTSRPNLSHLISPAKCRLLKYNAASVIIIARCRSTRSLTISETTTKAMPQALAYLGYGHVIPLLSRQKRQRWDAW